jgi:uncharacterized protein
VKLPIVEVPRPRAYPPRKTAFTAHFWDGLADGVFSTTRCQSCRTFTFPPKPFCPHCWHEQIEWVPLSGRGRLYSATRIHAVPAIFASETPIAVGIVDLDEGVRVAMRIWTEGAAAQLPLDVPVDMLVLRFTDGPLFAAKIKSTSGADGKAHSRVPEEK